MSAASSHSSSENSNHLSRPSPQTAVTGKALMVWAAAVLLYVIAITGRTSFGVAGVEAIQRFHVDASRIAVFTAVQVGVYALAQIPTGILIDRFGPRRLLLFGALCMGFGQIVLGFSSSYGVALIARVLIGAGDATAFLSVMRLLPLWFPLRKTPIFSQLSASIGQLGQFISAVPFLALLHTAGWTWSFLSLGAVGILVAMAAAILVDDAPDSADNRGKRPLLQHTSSQAHSTTSHPTKKLRVKVGIRSQMKKVTSQAVCWQAFFTHYTGILPQLIFTMLWGMPLMTMGMGLSSAQAGLILTINTIGSIIFGPVMGFVSARLGQHRDIAGIIAASGMTVAWLFFFYPTTPRGFFGVFLISIVTAACTPVSNFGFDYVREELSPTIVATGTGLGNMGGFLAGMITTQLFGFLLDAAATHTTYTWHDFRFAWLSVPGMWFIGMMGLIIARRRRRASAPCAVRYIERSEG
ncbi:MFS transporter [Corynebacterium poyangense]|uniref:MFS transporter n=1 Tax=Corynebacterium poyangense TaxID=2684405 RepID=UPI001CCEAAE2|nr:MFS transporter [Corynebacterium poyangense]